MNTSIVVSLDTRRAKKDGTYPIILRLTHNSSDTRAISTGYSIPKEFWNEDKRKVTSAYKGVNSVARLNNELTAARNNAWDIVIDLDKAGTLSTIHINDLKALIENKAEKFSVFLYIDKLVEELQKANRIGTARSYKGLKRVLKTFNNDRELSFEQITFQFLKSFETAHLEKGNAYNGLAVYMRTLRAIYNRAIKDSIVKKENYPFSQYKIKTTPTEKRALEADFLKSILNADIKPGQGCFNARNYFLASYMMYGMNYSDMAHLKKSDIINGRINYRRRKTSKLYDIKITPQLQEILTHYINKSPDSEYVFPILKRESAVMQDRDIQWARKRYNKKLKDLATLCGIKTNLTSYVSRHSFATQAMLQDVPLNAISSMLGHSSLKTTEIYLKSLPSNILDDYNSNLMKF